MPVQRAARTAAQWAEHDTADLQLVKRLTHGDADAFREIFDAYAYALIVYAKSLLKNGDEPAEDIVYDLFTHLWIHRHTLDVDSGLRAYLYRATRNRCWSVLRHERVVRTMAEGAGIASAEPVTAPSWQRAEGRHEDNELAAALANALSALPERPREVWRLNRVHGLQYTEIAKLLDLSVKTVETHMSRALNALRIALADWR